MSRWITFGAAAVLAVAVVGCGANGGDPVARQQIPAGPADSPRESMGSGSGAGSGAGSNAGPEADSAGGRSDGSDQGGSGGGGGAGSGSRDDHARKVGLPESIRIKEIGPEAFVASVVAACGSKDGAPGCLTVTYRTVADPDQCSFGWESDPPKSPTPEGTESVVRRGSHITVTICPTPDDTTSPAPADTTSPAPGDEQASTSDSPTATP
jgi:hypothetical protein